jgi:hypothetical protein
MLSLPVLVAYLSATLDFSDMVGQCHLQRIIIPSSSHVHIFVHILAGCRVLTFARSIWKTVRVTGTNSGC